MRIKASIEPYTAPITQEMVDKLPEEPVERHRSQVVYYSSEHAGDEKACLGFLNYLHELRPMFIEAFGTDYETHLYLEGDEGSSQGLFLDQFDLQHLVAINATLHWRPDPD